VRTPLLLIACLAALVAGCGSSRPSDARPDKDATLLLDFAPNAVHAGIYLALDRDYDQLEGVRLQVNAPSSSTDAVKLLLTGRTDMAILDIHDLAIAREKGRDLVGVQAIVQTPLAALLAQPSIRRPRDLEGRKAGVTGLPSDVAVLDSIVRGDGGDPSKVHPITIGFNAVPALLSRRVDAATAFWNAEGVALHARRPAIREFRVDDYGAPSYPELVLVTSRESLETNGPVIRATVRALRRGYTAAIDDPEAAISALVDAEPDLRAASVRRELDAVSPSFTEGVQTFGVLDPARLRQWALWEKRFGIVDQVPDVDRAFSVATSRTPD
jgi:ABC-type nitrate/sulfonate/bicarbonate transport system substrate-binding protein